MAIQKSYFKTYDEDKKTEWSEMLTSTQKNDIIMDTTDLLEEIVTRGNCRNLLYDLQLSEKYSYGGGVFFGEFRYDKLILTTEGLQEKLAVKKNQSIFPHHIIETKNVGALDGLHSAIIKNENRNEYSRVAEKYCLSPQNLKELLGKMSKSFYKLSNYNNTKI